MKNAAFATYLTRSTVVNGRKAIEIIVDVDSTNGWLGACRLYTFDRSKAQDMAYNEADRRALAQGLNLEYLRRVA
jgi:hypothetical protein